MPQKERGLLQATIHVTNAKDPSRASFAEVLIFDIVAKVDPNYAPLPEFPEEEKDQPLSPEKQLRPEIEHSERSFSVYSHQPGSATGGQGDMHATIQDLSLQVAELRSVLEGGSPTHSSYHSPTKTNQVSNDTAKLADESFGCLTSHRSTLLFYVCLLTTLCTPACDAVRSRREGALATLVHSEAPPRECPPSLNTLCLRLQINGGCAWLTRPRHCWTCIHGRLQKDSRQ